MMGGHAFKNLYCPRINPDVYFQVKAQATTALQIVFTHVVVPDEMPEKVRLRGRVLFPLLSTQERLRRHRLPRL